MADRNFGRVAAESEIGNATTAAKKRTLHFATHRVIGFTVKMWPSSIHAPSTVFSSSHLNASAAPFRFGFRTHRWNAPNEPYRSNCLMSFPDGGVRSESTVAEDLPKEAFLNRYSAKPLPKRPNKIKIFAESPCLAVYAQTFIHFCAAEGESTAVSAMPTREFLFRHCSLCSKILFAGDVSLPRCFLMGNMGVSIRDGTSFSGITTLLRAWSGGDSQALDHLTPLVYEELYRLAQCHMAREKPDHILQNTALINEIYVQFLNLREVDWQNRSHFFAVCSQLMRHTLAGYARSRLYLKRGGDAQQVPFDENLEVPNRDPGSILIALDDALHDLAAFDERMSQVVQLRFFGGFSVEETAHALKISERTVRREWESAKVWLVRELKRGEESGK